MLISAEIDADPEKKYEAQKHSVWQNTEFLNHKEYGTYYYQCVLKQNICPYLIMMSRIFRHRNFHQSQIFEHIAKISRKLKKKHPVYK
jgi:hypothetical protein